MRPLKNPNAWSCLPTAFATALEVDLATVLGIIGHDGSEITHPALPEPLCRRGFHPQEMIKMCLRDDLSVTRVELCPQAISSEGVPHSPKLFDTGGWDWFKENLCTSKGVLECRTHHGIGHAMAYQGEWSHAIVCDPATKEVFQFHELSDTEQRNRFVFALWRIEDIEE